MTDLDRHCLYLRMWVGGRESLQVEGGRKAIHNGLISLGMAWTSDVGEVQYRGNEIDYGNSTEDWKCTRENQRLNDTDRNN